MSFKVSPVADLYPWSLNLKPSRGLKFFSANFITKQSAIPFAGGSYQIDMGMVPENFMSTTEDLTTQKDPLSFFADGGLASMFTRRG